MTKEGSHATPGMVTMRELAPTLRYEALLVAEMAGTIATFADVRADVLPAGGDMGVSAERCNWPRHAERDSLAGKDQ